jgi:PPK2 family polyphosphate:nucleotide phosphotransferase
LDFSRELIIPPDKKIKLTKFDPADTLSYEDDDKTKDKLQKTLKRLDDLQDLLYAEKKRVLLIVLQGMDAAGKDGTIRHVMSGVSPQGCSVTSFKIPNSEELAHDFLWRIHKAVPAKGMIGIFNRSQYEDVLVVRVHGLVPKEVWKARYGEINRFERNLAENDVKILKFFLHISKEEQEKRFQERLHDPRKRWKYSKADPKERKRWDDYVNAYEAVLSRCSTEYAPWYIIPSDHCRNLGRFRYALP